MQGGEVFGSKDYFSGLAVIVDTYSNHNGPHNVSLFMIYKLVHDIIDLQNQILNEIQIKTRLKSLFQSMITIEILTALINLIQFQCHYQGYIL